MKKILRKVTITGADDSIDPISLFQIAERYPFVEWGILLSKSSEGNPRFPSTRWLRELVELQSAGTDNKISLSGHICGRWVRDICSGGFEFYNNMRDIILSFQRFQLNFHSYLHRIHSTERFVESLRSINIRGQQIIFQFDNVNNSLLDSAKDNGVDAVPLFDLSGGAGVLPKEWKQPVGDYCGYAGGLSPDNLEAQLTLIADKLNGVTIWIDAETRLRSNNDRQFDLKKVNEFLATAKFWLA